jgi:magnesium transporter
MAPRDAEELRALSQYSHDVAGGLMVKEYLAYPEDATAGQVVDDLRANADKYRDYEVQYAYVTDADEKLVGVLRLRDLLLARQRQPVSELLVKNPLTVLDTTRLDELRDIFEQRQFFGLPVTHAQGQLLGVVRRTALEEALGDRAASDYRKSLGIIQEELRTMPLLVRSRRRLTWLSANIGLNIMAASVIALYQDTLAQVIALAVFLPIISDMSGCSGNQAVAVSMRELALGLVKPNELRRVWLSELLVGVINGAALGLLIAAVAWLWKGNPCLGLVVGAAMAINSVLAVSLGGTLPLLVKRMNMDPAVASGPLLTTLTDMCGFFLILSLAAALLPWLATG